MFSSYKVQKYKEQESKEENVKVQKIIAKAYNKREMLNIALGALVKRAIIEILCWKVVKSYGFNFFFFEGMDSTF
jgi:hypothetical protein